MPPLHDSCSVWRTRPRVLTTGVHEPTLPFVWWIARRADVDAELRALSARLADVERAELQRCSEHAAAVDQLERLFKRFSMRIARETAAAPANGEESPLALRTRVRGF